MKRMNKINYMNTVGGGLRMLRMNPALFATTEYHLLHKVILIGILIILFYHKPLSCLLFFVFLIDTHG